jgi:hypothetical protein
VKTGAAMSRKVQARERGVIREWSVSGFGDGCVYWTQMHAVALARPGIPVTEYEEESQL